MMKLAAALLAAFMVLALPANGRAETAQPGPPDRVLAWIKGYRAKPERHLLPEAVKALAQSGAFQEPDAAGLFVGFMAGVLASNPDHAEKLVMKMLMIEPEDNWAVVRAVAYSGLPQWRELMIKIPRKAPNRQTMVDAYL